MTNTPPVKVIFMLRKSRRMQEKIGNLINLVGAASTS